MSKVVHQAGAGRTDRDRVWKRGAGVEVARRGVVWRLVAASGRCVSEFEYWREPWRAASRADSRDRRLAELLRSERPMWRRVVGSHGAPIARHRLGELRRSRLQRK